KRAHVASFASVSRSGRRPATSSRASARKSATAHAAVGRWSLGRLDTSKLVIRDLSSTSRHRCRRWRLAGGLNFQSLPARWGGQSSWPRSLGRPWLLRDDCSTSSTETQGFGITVSFKGRNRAGASELNAAPALTG